MAGSSPCWRKPRAAFAGAPPRERGGRGAVSGWTGQLQLPLCPPSVRPGGLRLAQVWAFSSAESQGLAELVGLPRTGF